jgi:N6-adenosine-specific RNA methylase IME4
MNFHPLSELFPLMQGREFDELVADIKANGLREPIWTYDGQILDGRNRWRACETGQVAHRPMREYAGNDPVSFVVSLNLHRRHLDESQRQIVAAKIANATHGGDRRSDQAASLPVVTQAAAAGLLNVSERGVRTARQVIDRGTPELVTAVESGRVSVSAAADVAELPKEAQRQIVAKGEKEILEAAKQIRESRAVERRQRNDELRTAAMAVETPRGKYRCIVIDPPWDVQKYERDVRPNQSSDLDYPTLTHEQIAEFDIGGMASGDGCHLFCWTTQKHLPPTLSIIEQWGFKYCLVMVWHKSGGPQPFGLPQYNCEFVVYARKGSPDFRDTKQFFTCFNAPRREHSRKPDEFYELIERVTYGPRIDIFSREPRNGFEQFGNETGKFAA